MLRSRGRLRSARDGADGLHHVSANDYTLIVLDLNIPAIGGVDPLESLNLLQAGVLGRPQSYPDVIVTTCYTEDDLPTNDILRQGRGRVRAVLRKPIDLSKLSNLIKP